MTPAFERLSSFEHLFQAFTAAARGKRGHATVAAFEHRLADNLLDLRRRLVTGAYQPGAYVHFTIHEPKRRVISAAPFEDRVVHHALCSIIEPRLERLFIADSYANRIGKGTHAAVDRLQELARRHRFVLRCDIVKHFPSIDHEVLLRTLARAVPEPDVMDLVRTIVAGGEVTPDAECEPRLFPGDDLLALCRPRGLPIGNLTSQFWSNCYLHPFDQFVTRELRCAAYIRYVDDFALFADSKRVLWEWKRAVICRLAQVRLTIHESAAQVMPTRYGIPWLGFVVYPTHRYVKARKVVAATRGLRARFAAQRLGQVCSGAVRASVHGWVNHVRYADTWGLQRRLFAQPWFRLSPQSSRSIDVSR